eukprot:scaffold25796_cov17-Tisochrysis_lutea.AAC.1
MGNGCQLNVPSPWPHLPADGSASPLVDPEKHSCIGVVRNCQTLCNLWNSGLSYPLKLYNDQHSQALDYGASNLGLDHMKKDPVCSPPNLKSSPADRHAQLPLLFLAKPHS